MKIEPYLFFNGRSEEALAFYGTALGAEVEFISHYRDAPPPPAGGEGCGPGQAAPPDKIMHASLRVGTTRIMVSDGNCTGEPHFQGFSLSITVEDAAACNRVFDALADGGQAIMPVAATFFSPAFGVVQDRFGVSWMVMVEG